MRAGMRWVAAITLVASLAGCATAASDRPLIVVTTNILGDVVRELVGPDVEVMTLMPPGADPHSFQISAQEAARIGSADLLVSSGLGLEEGVQHHVDTAVSDGAPTIVAGDHVQALAYASGDAEGIDDPHFWTDPTTMIDVVDALAEAIDAAVPGIPALQANADVYVAQLNELDDAMTTAFAAIPAERRILVTNHHVFGYLAARYDLEILGVILPSGTALAAPSASDLKTLVTAIERTGTRTIFADSSSPTRLAEVLADEASIDVEVVELFTESLSEPGQGAETYLELMRSNLDRIIAGLSS